jgi:hypothetical protein
MWVFAVTLPMNPAFLRILATVLAPVQWGIVFCYFRYWDALPKHSSRRIVAWLVVFLLNVVMPIGIYRLNAKSGSPDVFVDAVVILDAVVFILLVLYMVKKRSRAQTQKETSDN